jgi:septal ring factor EnvC (AmiA/AmiB activator)
MITLEQIRLLESKITRAIELIRVLKEENSTLRKGLESAQKRMRELESLVDGFKTDQKEIESVIVRTLQHLDDLEEASSARKTDNNGKGQAEGPAAPERPATLERPAAPERSAALERPAAPERPVPERPVPERAGPERPASAAEPTKAETSKKEELDIF